MKIAGYEVVRQLGKGGMSEVFEVERPGIGRRLALKLFAYPKEDETVRARFETEGRLLAKLDHPRVVKVFDLGTEEGGRPYFVMELVLSPDGGLQTLADVPEGSADEELIGRWYDDIREGLDYIHAHGIVHRDLKLQNVMIGPDGHAVIVDFGISKILDPGGDAAGVDPVQTIIRMKKGQNLVMGSLGYMAPELELGLPASPKSDWFALGVIVFRLLTGTWCDSRTDLVSTLATYDPVWSRILPKLLHSNPDGRECLSWAEEKARDRERLEAHWEERWISEKSRSHRARHLARYASGLAVLLAIGLGWLSHEFRAKREIWRSRYEAAGLRPAVPDFAELFKVPTEAGAEERSDDEGNLVMPSRAQFEAARIDALVLLQPVFSGLATGDITIERAIEELEKLSLQLEEGSETDPFDGLHFGGNDYMQFGESAPLKILVDRAVDRLRRLAED